MSPPTPTLTLESARARLRRLGFYGLLAQAEALLSRAVARARARHRRHERARRSLKRRLDNARLGAFKPLADFDWAWPTKCDRSTDRGAVLARLPH